MLILAFPNLKGNPVCEAFERFFRHPVYVMLVALLMAASELFAYELQVYYIYLALLFLGFLFTEDTLCAVPIACCAYMTLSPLNNPAKYPQTTVFNDPAFVVQFTFILSAAMLLLLAKALTIFIDRGKSCFMPELFGGFAVLGLSYMLGGAFTPHFSWKNVLFGFSQLTALSVLYVIFVMTVDWRRIRKAYFPILFTAIGVGMCAEVLGMYTLDGVFTAAGEVDRTYLFTGWGIYNNVACIMAMCIPAPFYLAATRRRGWPYFVLAVFFYLCLLLTQSRGGMLFGSFVTFLCVIYLLLCCKPVARRGHLAVCIAVLTTILIGSFFLHDQLEDLFASIIRIGMDSNNRDTIYKDCWEMFLSSPWFGVGFYDTPGYSAVLFSSFIPPRAHNTYIQILTSCGLFGIAAYLMHRIQTVTLFVGHPTHEKTFVAFSALALLLTSIVDCNFFNFGPAILYGVLFALAEGFEHVRRGRRLYFSLLTPVK